MATLSFRVKLLCAVIEAQLRRLDLHLDGSKKHTLNSTKPGSWKLLRIHCAATRIIYDGNCIMV